MGVQSFDGYAVYARSPPVRFHLAYRTTDVLLIENPLHQSLGRVFACRSRTADKLSAWALGFTSPLKLEDSLLGVWLPHSGLQMRRGSPDVDVFGPSPKRLLWPLLTSARLAVS